MLRTRKQGTAHVRVNLHMIMQAEEGVRLAIGVSEKRLRSLPSGRSD